MHDHGPLRAQLREDRGHRCVQLALADAQQLPACAGRIAERSQQVEDRRRCRAACGPAATCFIAGCNRGAKQKQMPSSSRQRSTTGTGASTFTPSAASTSAEPLLLVMLRLPCLATGTPAAAVTIAAAVLMLNRSLPIPPVPQVSIRPVRARADRRHVLPHRQGRAGDLVDRLALCPQRGQQHGDLVLGHAAPA